VLHHILILQLFTSLISKRKLLLYFGNSVLYLLSNFLIKSTIMTSYSIYKLSCKLLLLIREKSFGLLIINNIFILTAKS